MKFGMFALALPYYDGDGGPGSGAPAAPAAPPTPGGQPSAPAPGAPGAPPAAPAGQPHDQPAAFTYKEDRSNWVPSHVVRQATERARQIEQELAIERQRVAALTGVKPPAPPRNPEHDAIRSQLFEVAPELKRLADLADKLEKLGDFDPSVVKRLEETQQQTWVAHGTSVLQTLTDKVKAVYGGADLPPKALQRVARAFVSEVQDDPDLRARYEVGDLTIVDDFVKDYTAGNLDPYRRTTQAAAAPARAAAARLPRGGGSSAIVGARPATLKPSDPKFHEAAFARFNQE